MTTIVACVYSTTNVSDICLLGAPGTPVVHSGVKNMTVLKTTQSGFEGFHQDRFTTLKEAKDRCFCTSVYARWRYNKLQDVNFDSSW